MLPEERRRAGPGPRRRGTSVSKTLCAPDLVILAYQTIVAGLIAVFWYRLDHPELYWSWNLGLILLTLGLAFAEHLFPSAPTRFLHAWNPALVVLASFRQLAQVIRHIHPYEDRRWDHVLQTVDERWFGDTTVFFRSIAWEPAADLLTICYWSYFVQPFLLGAMLYRPPDLKKFRESVTVLLTGWFWSYLGYFLVPAVGPHRVIDGARAEELQGIALAGPLHDLLLRMEGSVPDAFPSGHALIAMLILVLAWKHSRKLFWTLLPLGLGLVAATLYLRYHYIVDVVAAALMVPTCIAMGTALHRGWGDEERV